MPPPVTSTGIPALDKALGKVAPGYPVGGITELHGLPENGSSAACVAAAEAALAEGRRVVYFDYGGAILERLRVEDDLTVHVNYMHGDAVALVSGLRHAIRDGVGLVIVDSIDRIHGGRLTMMQMGEIGRLIHGSSTAVLIARRYMEHPDPHPWNELAYHSSLRIRLSCHRDEDEPELHKVRADLVKVRTGTGKPRPADFYLRDGIVEAPRRRKKKAEVEEAPSRYDREDIV